MSRADILMEAADVARTIAGRCRTKAAEKTGDDRKHWRAISAGASMVALKLTELADAADRPAEPTSPADTGDGGRA